MVHGTGRGAPGGGGGTALGRQSRWAFDPVTYRIEFDTVLNRSYQVQYSLDAVRWKTAEPAVVGTGKRASWVDDEPPKTDSPPASEQARFYRALRAP